MVDRSPRPGHRNRSPTTHDPYSMDRPNPYESGAEPPKRTTETAGNSLAKWLLVPLLGVVGVVAGVLIGFFGGFVIFGHAGDFTMIFVTGCIAVGAAVGCAVGVAGGFALAKSIR